MSVLLNGIGVSKGIAIGQAYILYREQPEIPEHSIPDNLIKNEIKRFHKARKQAQKQLRDIQQKVADDIPQDISQFIETNLLMLEDPVLCDGTINQIEERKRNAEWALQAQCNRLVKVFEEMDDPYLKTRKDDIIHVVQRIQSCLMTDEPASPADEDMDHLKGRIIIADDLTPADTILMQHQKIAGFVTEYGGPLSHTAILARNLGIPAVIGVHNAQQLILASEWLIIDGDKGTIVANPDKKTLKHFKSLQKDEKSRKRNLFDLKNKKARTLDGIPITLNGNIDRPADIKILRQYDHTGVGLYRTEMLFIERDENPDEDEQYETYRRALRALKDHPLTIRTVDLGADKELSSTLQHGPLAHNPAMGLRAIRRCLKEPEQFLKQIRAILRAGAYGPVRMMIPMLSCLDELDQTLELINQAKNELTTSKKRFDPAVPVGAMIEVPSAALAAHHFAEKLDFLSIGTNDLIQYTLALDRIDDEVSHLYQPLNLSVLKLIDITLQAGRKNNIDVSLCGEMASDPKYTRLLLGMGLKNFSVQANTLLEIKHVINNSRIDKLSPKIRKLLSIPYPDQIEQKIIKLNNLKH
ncbi:MAG: phosphoenolpyruvate--protein phosphotransferase [Gammaproteobacteria bacterium]|nr:phosphoenolpyruvate--protein phosphotransferase [Gammaproteobacteria bacterium]